MVLRTSLLAILLLASAAWSHTQTAPPVEERDIVFVRGVDSLGTCDQAEQWVEEYLESPDGRALFSSITIGRYLHFDYSGRGSYDCPRAEPAYVEADTCDGVAKAAAELKDLVDSEASAEVTVVAHSMGGLVAAYLVATDQTWARSHIASVVTFDSALAGFSDVIEFGELLLTKCNALRGNSIRSLADMSETSEVVSAASSAAGIVPFYALDATQEDIDLLGIEYVARDRASLDGSQPFQWLDRCGREGADIDTCEPPKAVDDDHETVWACRFDESEESGCPANGLDKAFLVGCAASVTLDCSFLRVPVSQGKTTEASMTVPPAGTSARFATSFDGAVSIQLTSPDGTVYGPGGEGGASAYIAGDGFEVYEIDRAAPGRWTVRLAAGDTAHEGEEALVSLLVSGDLPNVDAATDSGVRAQNDGTGRRALLFVSALLGAGIIGGLVLAAALWRRTNRPGRSG